MKNLLIILFVFIGLTTFSQRIYTDSILFSGITGSDTTLFIPFKTEMGSGIIFDFTSFDADDAILDFGYSNDGIGMVSIDDNRNPFTLDSTTYTKTVNGVTTVKLGFNNLKWSYKYICFKLTVSSVTTRVFEWRFVR